MASSSTVTIVGAGLVGSLLATFLARRGLNVHMLERRPDMRRHAISAGRSINLAISTRGIKPLTTLGIADDILKYAIPMKGRKMHAKDGELSFQPYGIHDWEFINSISRATLNKALMTHAEQTGRVKIDFDKRVADIDIKTNTLEVVDESNNSTQKLQADVVIGTDGSASAIRHAMEKLPGYQMSSSTLDYAYKELLIPPGPNGEFLLEKNALHIWPRGTYMLIALPNFEGSFTCTLFLPFEGDVSFQKLNSDKDVLEFFEKEFADSVPLMSDLTGTFFSNPTGHMTTVKCNKWNVDGKVLLMGDAAHGIVPFFGQGMNCGFEDCTILNELLDSCTINGNIEWQTLFEQLGQARVPNTNAIADMAVENFIEMRDKVGDKRFLQEKAVEKILQKRFPGRYISRYSLVTFSTVPYRLAYEAGVIEDQILRELCAVAADPENVDLQLAERLIDQKLTPVLAPFAGQLQTASR